MTVAISAPSTLKFVVSNMMKSAELSGVAASHVRLPTKENVETYSLSGFYRLIDVSWPEEERWTAQSNDSGGTARLQP
jgi:hypothetical protein